MAISFASAQRIAAVRQARLRAVLACKKVDHGADLWRDQSAFRKNSLNRPSGWLIACQDWLKCAGRQLSPRPEPADALVALTPETV